MVRETHVALHHRILSLILLLHYFEVVKAAHHPVIGDYFTITAQPDVFDIYVVLL